MDYVFVFDLNGDGIVKNILILVGRQGIWHKTLGILSKYPSLGPQDAVEEVAIGFRVQGTMIKAISVIV